MRGGTSACTVGAGLDVLEKIFRELQLYGAVFAEGGRCAVGQHADQGASRCYGGAEGTWSAGDREVARQQGESSSQDGGRCTGGSQTVVKDPPPLYPISIWWWIGLMRTARRANWSRPWASRPWFRPNAIAKNLDALRYPNIQATQRDRTSVSPIEGMSTDLHEIREVGCRVHVLHHAGTHCRGAQIVKTGPSSPFSIYHYIGHLVYLVSRKTRIVIWGGQDALSTTTSGAAY